MLTGNPLLQNIPVVFFTLIIYSDQGSQDYIFCLIIAIAIYPVLYPSKLENNFTYLGWNTLIWSKRILVPFLKISRVAECLMPEGMDFRVKIFRSCSQQAETWDLIILLPCLDNPKYFLCMPESRQLC